MGNEETKDGAELEDLSPAEALASTNAAREALARRVNVPWAWDAFSAAGTGLFVLLVTDPPYPWLILVVAPWPIASVWMRQARQNRLGVALDGVKRRTIGHRLWWFIGIVLAVLIPPAVLDVGWGITRFTPVAAGVCAVMLYVFFRGVNRRVIAAIRNAP